MSIIPARIKPPPAVLPVGAFAVPLSAGPGRTQTFHPPDRRAEATDAEINGTLTRAGFRRSHDIVYRPACPSCNACTPVRVPVRAFKPSRSLKRIATINRGLFLEVADTKVTDEQL